MIMSFALSPNKTYKYRLGLWERASKDGDLTIGVLEIRESKNKSKYTIRRYCVAELPLIKGTSQWHRRFQLTKPGGIDKHFVCLKDKEITFDQCVCKGYEKQGYCSHIEALRAIASLGGLPVACEG